MLLKTPQSGAVEYCPRCVGWSILLLVLVVVHNLVVGVVVLLAALVGAAGGLNVILRVLCNPGDEVIVPVPSFVCYGPLTSMAGGTPVYLELKAEHEFRLTAEALTRMDNFLTNLKKKQAREE